MALPPDSAAHQVPGVSRPYFYTEVDKTSRPAMAGFLMDHFRYHTMNSWNRSRSFANCIKVTELDLPDDVQRVMFDALDHEHLHDELQPVLDAFSERWNHNYGIGFNGRSAGYLVLYGMDCKDSGFESQCGHCHSLLKTKVDPRLEPIGLCPRCRRPQVRNLKKRVLRYSLNCKGYGEDFYLSDLMDEEQYSLETLADEVTFIQDFDKTCSDYVEGFIDWCRCNLVTQPDAASA